ncbi:MAG: DUF1223 domain-containing protein [Gammaproteobacteria bacterium AqS3]|nr:DUF1223 domain-containing protein [Gammaproteobacteria bacterium AqS3]
MSLGTISGVLMLAASAAAGSVQALEITSPEGPTEMIEVFTSEGCSSCPPADAWLRGLVDHPQLWSRYIPLGWHVDYWNRLGWRDRFSSPEYSVRQRRYRSEGGVATVYTPGFVVSGDEWRNWFEDRSALPKLQTLDAERSGRLRISVDGDAFSGRYSLAKSGQVLHLAVLGFGLESEVTRGENNGRTLRHDFVVLDHRSYPLGAGATVWTGVLPKGSIPAPRYALVGWISERGQNRPLQAAGGWLR